MNYKISIERYKNRGELLYMGYEFERIYKGSKNFPVGLFNQTVYLSQEHYHMEYELFYLAEGTVDFHIENTVYHMKKNDVLFINPGSNHFTDKPSENFNYYCMVFDSSVLGMETDSSRKLFDNIIVNQMLNVSQPILDKIVATTKTLMDNDFGKEIAIKTLLFELILYIINTNQYAPLPAETTGIQNESKSINNGINFIKNHYRENITFDDLLKSTNYSKSHFIRLFKSATGMNYTDYLNKYRVEKACRDLIFTNKNVTEIATENGFNNIQYFSKIFKKYMECTPKQYQKQWNLSNQ